MVSGRTTSRGATAVNYTEARHYGHCRPSRQDIAWFLGRICRCRHLRRCGAGGTRGDGQRRCPATATRAQAAAERSETAQGGDGDLVCLLLRHAVAGDRIALRYPLQHALRTVRALDPARALASAARAATPHLAACLR